MKILKILFLLCFACKFIYADNIRLSDKNNVFTVKENHNSSFTFVNHLHSFNAKKIKTDLGDFVKLIIPNYAYNANIGDAELPVLTSCSPLRILKSSAELLIVSRKPGVRAPSRHPQADGAPGGDAGAKLQAGRRRSRRGQT